MRSAPDPVMPRPSLSRRAGNFAKALVREGVHRLLRRPARTAAEKALFHRTCQNCPGKYYNAATDECHHPGCGCPMKRKSRWDSTDCPGGYVDFSQADSKG